MVEGKARVRGIAKGSVTNEQRRQPPKALRQVARLIHDRPLSVSELGHGLNSPLRPRFSIEFEPQGVSIIRP